MMMEKKIAGFLSRSRRLKATSSCNKVILHLGAQPSASVQKHFAQNKGLPRSKVCKSILCREESEDYCFDLQKIAETKG